MSSVDIGGATRSVTTCELHSRSLRAGEAPLVRAVDRAGLPTPWFLAAGYDPYRDYAPTYRDGVAPSALASSFLDAALDLSYPVLRRPDRWYADDPWDDDYRSSYWSRHEHWEREGGWARAAPETSFGQLPGAPETAFGQLPTAAETAFAAYSARDRGAAPEAARPASPDLAAGPDAS